MKKIHSLSTGFFLLLCVTGISSYAQRGSQPVTPVAVGSTTFNVGVGVGATYKTYDVAGFGLKAALEFGLFQAGPGVITLGGEVGNAFGGNYSSQYGSFRSGSFIVAGRAAWHYGWQVPGLDTYGGVSAGVNFHRTKRPNYVYDQTTGEEVIDKYYNDNAVLPAFGIFAGASYFFNDKFGVNVEAGYDITNIQAGVIFKLR